MTCCTIYHAIYGYLENEELDKTATNKKYSGMFMNEQPCVCVRNYFTNWRSTAKICNVKGNNKEVRTLRLCKRPHFDPLFTSLNTSAIDLDCEEWVTVLHVNIVHCLHVDG